MSFAIKCNNCKEESVLAETENKHNKNKKLIINKNNKVSIVAKNWNDLEIICNKCNNIIKGYML